MNIGIIGGGISGLMAAYVLCGNKDNQIIIFESGKDLKNRRCPILNKKVEKCVKCTTCDIMQGMSGAGAFSDGKFNITTEYGGWLKDIKGQEETLKYIKKVDEILIKFGAQKESYKPNNELKKLCTQNDLHMLQGECKHLGTDANFETMQKLIEYLYEKENVKILTNTQVVDVNEYRIEVIKENSTILDKSFYDVDIIIFAVGRAGSSFLSEWCRLNKIEKINNQVDIGVRVELPSVVWEDFEKKIYEPKISYRTKQYGDTTRMFCFNGRGEVVTENTNGIITVNGHAYKDESKKTENSNFALLSTNKFTQPFDKPLDYVKHISGLANMIAGGGVLVQRLGDLENGRRTDDKRLSESTVKPTLKGAVAGDLSLCLPKRHLDNIIETLHALNKVAPGTSNYDTLLYGIECKYYSARPMCDSNFRISGKENIYAIGDGAGFTRSLSQAAAQGIMVGEYISSNYN